MRGLILFVLVLLLPACNATEPQAEQPPAPAHEEVTASVGDCNLAMTSDAPYVADRTNLIRVTCSQTTEGLLRRWAADFQERNPGATVEVEVTEYSSDIARMMYPGLDGDFAVLGEASGDSSKVLNSTQYKNSWPVIVGLDKLEIIVHPNNPVANLQVDQLAWIYSNQGDSYGLDSPRYAADRLAWLGLAQTYTTDPEPPLMLRSFNPGNVFLHHSRIDQWSELGVSKPPGDGSIHVIGSERLKEDSEFLELRTVGTPAYGMGSMTYCPRMPRDDEDIQIVESPAAMVSAVAQDPQAIGYVSHSQVSDRVRSVAVNGEPRTDFWIEQQQREDAPYQLDLPVLQRPLYLWIQPSYELSLTDLQLKLLKYLLSREGQIAVQEEGFFPLSEETAAQQLQAAMETPNLAW